MRPQLCLQVAAALALAFGSAPAAAADFPIAAGDSTADAFLGTAIGLDFRAGTLVAAWADNSAELAGNPDPPALDVAFAAAGGPNVNVTGLPGSHFGVSLAVDPTDPNRLVAAALGGAESSFPRAVRAFSRDGGATWTVVEGLPGNFGSFAPSVAFDAFGNCFIALVNDPTFGNPHLELFVSTDGGETFAPVAVPDFAGVEVSVSVAAGFGSVWLAFQGHDGLLGTKTFAAPVTSTGSVGAFELQSLTADGQTPDIALLPGGGAVVVYGHGQFSQTPSVSLQVDPDGIGGEPFGERITVANVPGYPNAPRPQIAVDGATGRTYVVYPDRQEGPGPEDVRLSFSDDNGASWSAAVTVNDPVHSRERQLANVAVDGDGTVGIAWYDFRSGAPRLFGHLFDSVVAPAVPRAPLNLTATPVSQSRIDLAWEDVSDNETGFQVERRTVNPFIAPVIVADLPAGSTSFSDTGLPADSAFGYRVRAVNGAGSSLWSNGAGATTLAFPPPAPQGLTATAVTFQRIDLAWQPVGEADSYEVQQSTDGVDFTTMSTPIVEQMMIFGLRSSTTYFFRVRAVNTGGASDWSNVASATTLAENQPAAPTELTATTISGSKILLMWRDNAVNETRFEILRSTGGGPFARAGTTSADAQRFTDTGLKRSTTYSYRVRACNGDLCSPASNTASATTAGR